MSKALEILRDFAKGNFEAAEAGAESYVAGSESRQKLVDKIKGELISDYIQSVDKLEKHEREQEKEVNSKIQALQRIVPVLQAREKQVISICGGQLGDCYILTELLNTLMVNYFSRYKKRKKQKQCSWYRELCKKYLNESFDEVVKSLTIAKGGSVSPTQYLIDFADAAEERLKPLLLELQKQVRFYLQLQNATHEEDASELLTLYALFGCINQAYEGHISFLAAQPFWDKSWNKVLDKPDWFNGWDEGFYDSWFDHAGLGKAFDLYNKGMIWFIKHTRINLPSDKNGIFVINNIPGINKAMCGIMDLIHDPNFSETIIHEVGTNDNGAQDIYGEAVDSLIK